MVKLVVLFDLSIDVTKRSLNLFFIPLNTMISLKFIKAQGLDDEESYNKLVVLQPSPVQ